VPPRIVLFGATGYTGRLAAEALAAAGVRPLLAGRDRGRLQALAGRLGDLPVATADTARPDSVRALVGQGDVLVSTVGPFLQRGRPAVEAAVEAGAAYLDATGEPPFLRQVFEEYGPRAAGRCGLVPAFGYDFVPGNLAGALALADQPEATSITVGYFVTGGAGFSSGTLASGAGLLLEPGFAWRDGRLRPERTARRVRAFPVAGRDWLAVSYGGSEHYALPRFARACATSRCIWAGSAAAPGRCGPPRRSGRRWPACPEPERWPGWRPRRWPGGPATARARRPGGPAAP
jgi:short subunit dehydrogenase-like uncharacterized protein